MTMQKFIPCMLVILLCDQAIAAKQEVCDRLMTQKIISQYAAEKCKRAGQVLEKNLNIISQKQQCDAVAPTGGLLTFTNKTFNTLKDMQQGMGDTNFCSHISQYLDGMNLGIEMAQQQ